MRCAIVGRRVRRHANPFNVPTRLEQLNLFSQFGRDAPIEVDVGCGGGDYLIQRAQNHPELDFLGFEIRKPLVEAANLRASKLGLKNVQFLYANIHDNMDFVKPGIVTRFFVQFPDPCFKKRHWKRRILQPFFVRKMVELLPLGGEIFVQSDVRPLAEEMYAFLIAEQALHSQLPSNLHAPNPYEERTEWERQHEREGESVHRMLFEKKAEPTGDIPVLPFRDTNPLRLALEDLDGSTKEESQSHLSALTSDESV